VNNYVQNNEVYVGNEKSAQGFRQLSNALRASVSSQPLVFEEASTTVLVIDEFDRSRFYCFGKYRCDTLIAVSILSYP
jgi:hypothetical protein